MWRQQPAVLTEARSRLPVTGAEGPAKLQQLSKPLAAATSPTIMSVSRNRSAARSGATVPKATADFPRRGSGRSWRDTSWRSWSVQPVHRCAPRDGCCLPGTGGRAACGQTRRLRLRERPGQRCTLSASPRCRPARCSSSGRNASAGWPLASASRHRRSATRASPRFMRPRPAYRPQSAISASTRSASTVRFRPGTNRCDRPAPAAAIPSRRRSTRPAQTEASFLGFHPGTAAHLHPHSEAAACGLQTAQPGNARQVGATSSGALSREMVWPRSASES